jgi:hypothetical protein
MGGIGRIPQGAIILKRASGPFTCIEYPGMAFSGRKHADRHIVDASSHKTDKSSK